MSQNVDRLKELLFDSESRELSDMRRRVDEVFGRAGSEERFTASVAGVIDKALRRAEVDRHAELADAVAPFVVRTVKTEIRNSRDELVEALYPVTGRMVKAYVASALKDLADDMNRRLEANPVMLRLKSLTSGKSVAELAMAEAQRLRIEELYLVRRGTGELVGRWPESTESDGRDHVMSGVLTAINEFSSEALKDDGAGLRQIDLGERQLYLRASQTYLLAAKCSGTAHSGVETILDEAFLAALERIQAGGGSAATPEAAARQSTSLLSDVSRNLDERITEKQSDLDEDASGLSPLVILAWIVGLPLALWIAWTLYADYVTERTQRTASQIVAQADEIKGYPTRIDVERLGHAVTLSGLAPSVAAKDEIVGRLRRSMPGSEIRDQLTVLPSGLAEIEPELDKVRRRIGSLEADVQPQFDRLGGDLAAFKSGLLPELASLQGGIQVLEAKTRLASVSRMLERGERRLTETSQDLARLDGQLKESDRKAVAGRAATEVATALEAMQRARAQLSDQGLSGVEEQIVEIDRQTIAVRQTIGGLSTLIGPPVDGRGTDSRSLTPSTDIAVSADDLAAECERLAMLTVAIAQSVALRNSLPPPPVVEPPTPRQQIEAWSRSSAIFFSDETKFRNSARADEVLAEAARLMRASDVMLRVVGYTDDKGGQDRNSPLSQSRAQTVVDALIARGVPAKRLVAVGRLDGRDLSPVNGETSPNRRVEFEVGFDGEGAE
ncbi:MAG: OmpA family protein [Hyphomicrobium sp.]